MKKLNFILIIFIISCTKEVTFDIPINENNIVVNGFIEKDSTAKILLSKSINPFDFNGDIESILTNNLVPNAIITITELDAENSDTETLISSFGVTDTWYYNYTGVKITGKEGKTYN